MGMAETGRRTAEAQKSQRQCRAGDFIGDPEKRHLLDEVADGTEQIRAPEERIIAVSQGVENTNDVYLLKAR